MQQNPPSSDKLPAIAYSPGFGQILHQAGISLAVSTYESGVLTLLRAERGGEKIDTRFLKFDKPMGLALDKNRLSLATDVGVWEFHNHSVAARKLEPPCDACFLPRCYYITGDILTHEMAYEAGNLVIVNTRFSCLATLNNFFSFLPCWKPPFISKLDTGDRCHLNGIGTREGEIRYVTALGECDTPKGWRDNKRNGGILMDVASDEIIARGLSMPHSPRWFNDRLWILQSGNGGIGVIDESSGHYQEVCRLPGFTRGMDFAGRYAFLGISRVRDTAVFSGIAVTEIPEDQRVCGLCAVDTVTGKIAGHFKFIDTIHEIFAVQVLNGMRWPDFMNERDFLADSYELSADPIQS